jgi:hypothetical protein
MQQVIKVKELLLRHALRICIVNSSNALRNILAAAAASREPAASCLHLCNQLGARAPAGGATRAAHTTLQYVDNAERLPMARGSKG